MSKIDTDFIILDENPVYANQISEFIQCLNLSCPRFQRPRTNQIPHYYRKFLHCKSKMLCNYKLIKQLLISKCKDINCADYF
jgi:hypothetical protein